MVILNEKTPEIVYLIILRDQVDRENIFQVSHVSKRMVQLLKVIYALFRIKKLEKIGKH